MKVLYGLPDDMDEFVAEVIEDGLEGTASSGDPDREILARTAKILSEFVRR